MEYSGGKVKTSKLSFKGEPKQKKKKRQHPEEGSSKRKSKETEEGWIHAPSATQIMGPLFLVLKHHPLALCFNNAGGTNKVYPIAVQDDEPTDVNHVWVCTPVQDSDEKVTLKSAAGKFLSADKVGVVSVDSDARGPQEEWEFISIPGTKEYALQSVMHRKYLMFDEVAGGKYEVRCDSESLGDEEVFTVKMQAEYKHKRITAAELKARKMAGLTGDGLTVILDVKGKENDNIREFQARGAGRLITSTESTSELRQANKEGVLGTAMLERRSKLKGDKFCK